MASNSITCESAGTPTVNTTLPYCILPYGSEKMQDCCQKYGNGMVHIKADCYFWCEMPKPEGESEEDKKNDLSRTTDSFKSCLRKGNDTDLYGMLCSTYVVHDGDGGDDASNSPSGGASTASTTPSNMPDSASSYSVTRTGGIMVMMLAFSVAANAFLAIY